MAYPMPGFYIDPAANRVIEVIEHSRRFIKYLDESEALALIEDDQCELYTWETHQQLTSISAEQRDYLKKRLLHHIEFDPDTADPSNHANGYCYLVMLWKKPGGLPILICHLLH